MPTIKPNTGIVNFQVSTVATPLLTDTVICVELQLTSSLNEGQSWVGGTSVSYFACHRFKPESRDEISVGFCGWIQSLQANPGVCLHMDKACYLTHLLQFCSHLSSNDWLLSHLFQVHIHKIIPWLLSHLLQFSIHSRITPSYNIIQLRFIDGLA